MDAALDNRCPICLDTWGSAAYTLPCFHQFCLPCIQRWANSKPECPLCKRRLTSIVHSVQADDQFEELVISPSAAASIDANRPPAQAPSPLVGGLHPDTWGQLFRRHPALLQPLLSWIHRELRSIFRRRRSEALIFENAIMETLCLFGLEEDLLVQLLELYLGENAAMFVQNLLNVAVQQCGREAHRLLGLNIPPAAEHREDIPMPEPGPSGPEVVVPAPSPAPSHQPASSNRGEVPGTSRASLRESASHPHSTPAADPVEQAAPREEPEEATAGPSTARQGRACPPGGTRRAPKRKNTSSQASSPPNKRPPRRRQ